MRMTAVILSPPAKDLTCEHCGKEAGKWGVVSKKDLQDLQDNASMPNKEAVSFLIFEAGIGEILCSKCLEERSGQPIPRKKDK